MDYCRSKCCGAAQGFFAVLAMSVAAAPASAQSTYWWDGTGTSWTTLSSWSTGSSTTTDPSVLSGTTDPVIFNINGVTTAQTLTLDGNAFARGLTFSSTGNVTIDQGTSGTLSVASGGILMNTGSTGTTTINAPLALTAANTLTVGAGRRLTLTGVVTGTASGAGQQTTMDISNSGGRIVISSSNATLGYVLLRDGTLSLDNSVASIPVLTLAGGMKVNRNGKFVMSSGTLNMGSVWWNGDASSGGSSQISGGTINHTAGSLNVGTAGGSQGNFGVSGSAVFNGSGRDLNMANQGESRAFFSVKDTASATVGNVTLGSNNQPNNYSSGIIEITGGSLTTGTTWVAKVQTNSTGVTLGTFNQWGGLVTVNGPLVLADYNQAAGTPTTSLQGTYNLASGTLVVQQILGGTTAGGVGGQARLNLRGGTLAVSSSASLTQKNNFISLTGNSTDGKVYVYEGGTIDTGAQSITIAQPLLAATGSGVTAIAITGTGSGFMTPPTVVITPAAGDTTGRGATATATMNANGTITGIQITSPGTGYTAVPTISFRSINNSSGWPMDVGYALTGTATIGSNSVYSGGITKIGSGTLTLSATNTYTGATTVNAGILALGVANAISNQSSLLVNGGGFNLAGFSNTVGAVTLSSGSIFGAGTLTSGSAYNLQAGVVSAILGGNVGLTKSTVGTVTLSGSNAYTGPTLVSSGTLAFGIDNAISGSSAITVGSAGSRGALALGAFDLTTASLTFSGLGGDLPAGSGGEIFLQATSGTATVSAVSGSSTLHPKLNLNSSALFTVDPAATFSLHADLVGSGNLVKTGSGTMTMHGSSAGFSGSTLLTQGRITVANANSLVFGTGTVTLGDDTILDLGGAAIDNVITFATGTATTAVILNSGSFVSLSGPGNISSGTAATISSSYKLLNTADITFESPLAGSALVQSGARGVFTGEVSGLVSVNAGGQAVVNGDVTGDVVSSGSTTILGAVFDNVAVNGGTTSLLGATAVGSVISTGTGGVAATALLSGTVNGGAHVGGLGRAEFSNLVAGAITSDVGGTVVLRDGYSTTASTISNNGLLIVDRTAALSLGAAIAGTGNLRVDAGSLTLTAANTYTGTTTVLGGNMLAVNGSLANAALDVAVGSTLKGSGSIAGLTTISGTHAPGNSPGVQTFANLTYNASSAIQWELWKNTTSNSPLAYDQVVVTGNLAFSGLSTSLSLVFTGSQSPTNFSSVSWTDSFWSNNQEWLLFDVAGSTTGFTNLFLTTTNWLDSTGAAFTSSLPDSSFGIEDRGGDVYIVYTIANVPEPGSLAPAGIGVAAVCWAAARRRRRAS